MSRRSVKRSECHQQKAIRTNIIPLLATCITTLHYIAEMLSKVLFTNSGTIRTATLNSPKTLNALDLDMVKLLTKQLNKFATNETVGAVILEGAKGAKTQSFCAGGDIVNLHTNASTPETRPKCTQFFLEEYTLNYMLKKYPKPLVSILDGVTMGGGVGLSVHGMFRIATENTVFAMPECSIGFFPDVGLTHLLPSLPIGIYLGMTGERLKGSEVVDAGIATHYIDSGNVSILKDVIEQATVHHVGKQSTPEDLARVVKMAIETVAVDLAPTLKKRKEISKVFDVDLSKSDAIDVIKGRLLESKSEWSTSALKKIESASPFALQATRELFAKSKKGSNSFGNQLSREFQATKLFMEHPDFLEGVSAAVIERRKPDFEATNESQWESLVSQDVELIDWKKRVKHIEMLNDKRKN